MKLAFIFSLLFCLQVAADGFSQKITLVAKDASLEKVLKSIEKQSGYLFWYKTDLMKKSEKVSISVRETTVEDALAKTFQNQPIRYSIVDQTVVLQPKKQGISVTPIKEILDVIKGQVRGSDGKPLIGVTVVVKASKLGTTTDAEGNFSVSAAKTDMLVFSYIGFDTKEVLVGNQSNISVSLTESNTTLGEVAVIGYGTQSRKTLASAVTTIKSEEMNRGAITDMGQMLQGKVPGLNITANGDPNKLAAVILRGVSTINSSQGPFYVIDNVPGADISTIAPDDIESIDILKDAAATAIYGNRAANGVIMVTTKRGKKGSMQVSYNGYVGIEKVSNRLNMMTVSQLKEFLDKNGVGLSPKDDLGADTDWQSAIQKKTAISTNHNLAFSGGTEHSTYSASLNYVDKQGILLNSSLKRIIARLAVEQYALKDKVRFGLTVTNSNTNADDIPYRNSVLLQSAKYLPVSPIKNEDGSYFENQQHTDYYNPVSMINNSKMNTKTNNLIGNFTTQVKLPFGLTYDLKISYLNTTYLSGTYYNKYYTDNYNNMYDNPEPGLVFHVPQLFGPNGQANR
ncbi:MAG: SusC/RagA family TonB-linked outer membrane protein, partial [Dyadobacter sp.]